ncbi:MAG TPA: tRNA pseudouridine(38-40) synthase TruA [Epulopiscium sp.]|nr:tRNA pseudouridine(38-40) synthase TruA [Candidatus Epulonipiscium sp.]
MQKIKLIVSYDGTRYYGWQRQDDVVSVQEELEKACKQLFKQEVKIQGAGRTDAGVHALGQCATLMVNTNIPMERVPLVLNNILPQDIVVISAEKVPDKFHAQYSAKSKTYKYQIMNADYPIPQMRHYADFVHIPLNVEAMNKGAQYFVGTHDFLAFCASRNTTRTTTRTIHYAKVTQNDQIVTFEVCGNGFLYNMVRIMVGTLIQVGIGKVEPSEISQIIVSKNRQKAGKTVPACGLTMCNVEY